MGMTARFAVYPVTSGLHDPAAIDRLVEEYGASLQALGGQWGEIRGGEDSLPILYFVLTGGSERRILQLCGRQSRGSAEEPVCLVAHPGHNSLPAALEVLARLRQEGQLGRIFYLAGPGELYREALGQGETTLADLEAASRVYLALRRLARDEGLDALALRCFDLVLDPGTTGCLALCRLNDEGIIAGCEGDLCSTVGMLWTKHLLGQLAWMANLVRVDGSGRALWLAHCTVPRSLVRGFGLRSHFESGLGVGIQGEFAAGPATLLRIGGTKLERLWLAEGEVTRAGAAEDLCRTQVEVALPADALASLLRDPRGNHLLLVAGHHAARLREWWEMMIPR